MPVYRVKEEGQPDQLIQAISSSAAIALLVEGRFTTETISKPDDLAELIAQGMTIRKASVVKAAPVDLPDGQDPRDPLPAYFNNDGN